MPTGCIPASAASRWREPGDGSGRNLVVITLGAHGAYALGPDGTEVRRPARPVVVADTVGAGDSFTAGLLDALQQRGLLSPAGGLPTAPGAAGGAPAAGGRDEATGLGRISAREVAEVVNWAVLVATLTCERPGADPPTRREALQAR